VGPREGLDGRKISSPPGFDPGPSRPTIHYIHRTKHCAYANKTNRLILYREIPGAERTCPTAVAKHSMEQNFYGKAKSSSTSQEIPSVL
jgi:hypothetical protein